MIKIGETKGKDGYVLYAANMLDLMGDVYVVFTCSNRQKMLKINGKG
ncbi:MAG: hypothetical protein CM1200mP28_02910 [Deltaproteobacteria bacterium]|nr:MAG: hypothetical protein CM1200mP28_02910 [Deltaproteobacteria bacterium]